MTTKTVSIEMTVVIDDDGLAFSNEDCTKMTYQRLDGKEQLVAFSSDEQWE